MSQYPQLFVDSIFSLSEYPQVYIMLMTIIFKISRIIFHMLFRCLYFPLCFNVFFPFRFSVAICFDESRYKLKGNNTYNLPLESFTLRVNSFT